MTEPSRTSSSPTSSAKPTKAFSCVRCFERKVKCDKEHPCSGCVRSNVECIFRVPAPPKRKKKRTQEDILTERLNRYEQILQQKGINIPNLPTRQNKPNPDTPPTSNGSVAKPEASNALPTPDSHDQIDPRSFVAAKLIWEEGRSRYTENNLWTRVAEEFQQSQDAIHESSDEDDEGTEEREANDNIDWTLGLTPSSTSARNLHPPPDHITALWQAFLDNVNPFSMIVHRPTLQPSLQKAALNLDHVPRGLEALMFSIYTAAVFSMKDREVENTFGESRKTLLARYRSATKASLARAKFMGSSDLVVLQAFVIHLLSMRDVYDGRTLWTLSGVALRMGEGMGLHRDGTSLGLPPFKTEMRRRLWYQIITLEYRTAELSGSNKFRAFREQHLTKPPLNLNDEDLWPGMTELPPPRAEITDMVLCSIRYEFSTFWAEKLKEAGGKMSDSLWENYESNKAIDQKDHLIDLLEQRLDERFVRHCDPTISVQLMASIVAKAAPTTMRFMAHHPRRWACDEDIPEANRKLLWMLCISIMDNYVTCMTSKSLERFNWHTGFYFQWQALIYLLDCVRADPRMPGAEDAWRRIDAVLETIPGFVTDTKKAIHVAVGSLCLKAYNAKEQAYRREGRFFPANPPEYIALLRQQRDAASKKQAERKAKLETPSVSSDTPATAISNDLVNMMGFETAAAATQIPTTQQYQTHLHQQQPLPQFQPPTNPPHRPSQQPAPYWFDSFHSVVQQTPAAEPDWMMMQDPMTDQGAQMDWTQWDYLLQDSGGMVGFGDTRTTM